MRLFKSLGQYPHRQRRISHFPGPRKSDPSAIASGWHCVL